jgi:hypothetical protein
MKFDLKKDWLLVLFLLADLAFIVLHLLYTYTSLLPSNSFSIEKPSGYSEVFQYIKELGLAALFLLLGIRKWKSLYFVFSLLFLYFFIDDAFELHERYGAVLADFFNLPPLFGLRPIDLGELLVFLFFGVHFLAFIGLNYSQSDRSTRTLSKTILVMIMLLILAGVVADMIHILLPHPALAILDDGGEMFIMSVIAWFVYRHSANQAESPRA